MAVAAMSNNMLPQNPQDMQMNMNQGMGMMNMIGGMPFDQNQQPFNM
jgi:hypothetical protein